MLVLPSLRHTHELLKVIGHSSQNLNYLAVAFFRRAYQEGGIVLVGLGGWDITWAYAYATTGLKSAGKISTLLVFRYTRIV
jgi:hypothetical protein